MSKLFYGWVQVLCCACMIMACSLHSTGMSTNLAGIRESYGFTGTQVSLILTVRSLTSVLAAVAAERYYQRVGLKKGMVLAMLFGAAAFGLFILAEGRLWLYYVGGAVAGICYAYGFILPASLLLRHWFRKSLGTALALAGCGTGLVNLVCTPSVQFMIDHAGIRSAFILQGSILLAVALMLIVLVVERPQDIRQEPYGGCDWREEKKEIRNAPGLSKQWIRAFFIATILIGMSSSPAVAHITLNFKDAGINTMMIAKGLSVFGFTGIVAKVIYGKVLDKVGAIRSAGIFGTLLAAGFLLCFVIHWFPYNSLMVIALVIISAGTVIHILGYPNWIADLDSVYYDSTMGKCQMGYQLGALAGSQLPGIIADLTGSYGWAYLLFVVNTVIVLAIVIFAYHYNSKS